MSTIERGPRQKRGTSFQNVPLRAVSSLQDIDIARPPSEVDALLIGVVVQVHDISPHAGIRRHGGTVDHGAVGRHDIHLSAQGDNVLVHSHGAHLDQSTGGGGVVSAAVARGISGGGLDFTPEKFRVVPLSGSGCRCRRRF